MRVFVPSPQVSLIRLNHQLLTRPTPKARGWRSRRENYLVPFGLILLRSTLSSAHRVPFGGHLAGILTQGEPQQMRLKVGVGASGSILLFHPPAELRQTPRSGVSARGRRHSRGRGPPDQVPLEPKEPMLPRMHLAALHL